MNGARADLAMITVLEMAARDRANIELGLALPATLLLAASATTTAVRIGAQDVHPLDSGAHTGGISAPMVRDAGASFVIVGHSECRAASDLTDQDIARKVVAVRRQGLAAILCVGEPAGVRARGNAEAFVTEQLRTALPQDADGEWLSVAYEPIWAIGSGRVATLEEIATMHAALRATCLSALGRRGARIRLLYGGSVTASTAAGILATEGVDGVLVGGASLTVEGFLPILASA